MTGLSLEGGRRPGGNSEAVQAGEFDSLHAQVALYYSGKIKAHGATPCGVDWSCRPTQEMRFVQLLKVCDFGQPFSITDLGCGYGAILGLLNQRWPRASIDYLGVDLADAMIEEARRLWRRRRGTTFAVGVTCTRIADYSVASGIFNVKLDQPIDAWVRSVRSTLADLSASSRRGFAVNFLGPLEAGADWVPELYRTSPDSWLAYCEKELGVRVEVLAAYGMREFTLLGRK